MNLKTKLYEELESQMSELNKLKVGSDEYKIAVDGVTKLSDRIIEIEKIEVEDKDKVMKLESDETIEMSKIEEMKKDRKSRFLSQIVITGLQLGTAVGFGLYAMYWEKTDTLTNTPGKSAMRDIFKFKW